MRPCSPRATRKATANPAAQQTRYFA